MEKVRFGIISCAGIAKRFILWRLQEHRMLLAAVASRDPGKSQTICLRSSDPKHGSYEALFPRRYRCSLYFYRTDCTKNGL